jgi:hypothetical protein
MHVAITTYVQATDSIYATANLCIELDLLGLCCIANSNKIRTKEKDESKLGRGPEPSDVRWRWSVSTGIRG